MKKVIKAVAYILFISSLIISMLILSIYFYAFNEGYQLSTLKRFAVDQQFPNLEQFNHEMQNYFLDKTSSIPDSIYLNEREISHMEDVKNIFTISGLLLKLSIIVFFITILLFNYYKVKLTKPLILTGVISLALALILLLFFFITFNSSFDIFHKLLFKQGTYLFSYNDNIIKIYPIEFFNDIAIRIFVAFVILSSLTLLSGLTLQKLKLS